MRIRIANLAVLLVLDVLLFHCPVSCAAVVQPPHTHMHVCTSLHYMVTIPCIPMRPHMCHPHLQALFESNMQQLTSMGFDRKAAGEALLQTNNNLQAAVDLLVAGGR